MSNNISDILHDMLNKLRIISKIKEGQKIDTSDGLNVYNDGIINWLFRKYTRNNKDENVKYLSDLYKQLQQTIETNLNELSNSGDTKKIKLLRILTTSALELRSSIKGLENLSKTYYNYPSTLASLEGILKDYIVVIYSSMLEAIPEDIIPNELLAPIIYNGYTVYSNKKYKIDNNLLKNEFSVEYK